MLSQRQRNSKKFGHCWALWSSVHPVGSSSSSSYGFLMYLGFFVIFKLGGDIYCKTHLKKWVPYFVKTSVFKIAGRISNFKTCILAFSKTQFQVKSQCQTHIYSRFCLKTHICPAISPWKRGKIEKGFEEEKKKWR